MSVAFTKEDSAETASETLLPDRPISPHPNLVTEAGLKALQAQLDEARAAQVMADPVSTDTVAFGSTVTFRRDDGRVQTYRIVGEDEADPKAGSISFVSPVARLLLGKAVGDEVGVAGQSLEIVSIA